MGALVGVALVGTRCTAAAEPFSPLPNGRVAVEIYGYRIGLASSEQSLHLVEFYPAWTARSMFGGTTFTLRQALAEPDKA